MYIVLHVLSMYLFFDFQLFTPTTQKLGSFSRNLRALSFEATRDYSGQSWRRKNTYVEQVLFGHTGMAYLLIGYWLLEEII